MGVTAAAYSRMMSSLLPKGRFLQSMDAVWRKLLSGCALELERLSARVDDLLDEMIPTSATEMLAEYESELGLPRIGSTEERRAHIAGHMVARQRYRPIDFQIALSPLLGQDIGSVVVIERTVAQAVAMGDAREIYRFFIYRDPLVSGSYFVSSAQHLLDTIKPSHTVGHVIESVAFLCDDPFSLCDRDLIA